MTPTKRRSFEASCVDRRFSHLHALSRDVLAAHTCYASGKINYKIVYWSIYIVSHPRRSMTVTPLSSLL